MNPSYSDLLFDVISRGDYVTVRGQATRERIPVEVAFRPGELVLRQGVNRALGYMELMQLLAGGFNLDALKRVAPRAQHELFTPQMAYGPRIRYQLLPVIKKLAEDPTARQAVLFIGDKDDGPTSDQPCTSTIQFLRRSGSLYTIVNMRSWDLVKGLTYDVVMFGGLALAVAHLLGDIPSTVSVRAGSGHVYEDDLDRLPGLGAKIPYATFGFADRSSQLWSTWNGALLENRFDTLRKQALDAVKDQTWTRGAPWMIAERTEASVGQGAAA